MSDYPGAKFPKTVQRVSAKEFLKELAKQERPGRYGIRKTDPQERKADGYTFDSGLELKRYGDLKLLQQAGKIRGLEVHPQVYLDVNGERIGYKPDFAYFDVKVGAKLYEECKGGATQGGRWPTIMKLWRAVGPGRLDVLIGTKRGYRKVREITPRGREE